MVDNLKFNRVSDTAYELEANNQFAPEISVDFDKSTSAIRKPEERYEVVNELFKNLNADEKNRINVGMKPVYFKLNNRQFVLHPKTNLILRIIAFVFRFLKIINNETRIEYRISPTIIPAFISKPRLNLNIQQLTTPEIDFDPSNEQIPVQLYSDPFTEMASELFQKFEDIYAWKDVDHPFNDGANYQIILKDGQLIAKDIDDKEITDEDRQNTLIAFSDFVRRQYGNQVIDRIQIQYGFDLDELIANNAPLTPEMIYRVNVGTSHVEVRDVEILAMDLREQREDFSVREKLGIQRLKESLNWNDANFNAWVQNIDLQNAEDYSRLMSIFELADEEQENIFTGRVIRGKISGWYTHGDLEKFKPWLDQQEFTQSCLKIKGRTWDSARNWDCFYEDLALILCKKHLYQKNENGSYRVGGLIPAPREEKKPQLYYKVTSLINNSRGIFSYTLEPTCEGSPLPVIKLYRSTSSDTYNLDGNATFKNDFNPVSSPGYEGSHLLFNKVEETEFITSRTIPVWVGYQYLADQQLGDSRNEETLDKARENLRKASKEIKRVIKAKYEKPSLKAFIRSHDSDFLELIHDCREDGTISSWKAWSLLNNSLRYAVRYNLNANAKEISRLHQFLVDASQQDKYADRAAELLKWWDEDEADISDADQGILDSLKTFKDSDDLVNWNAFIHEYAVQSKEDIQSKKLQKLDFVGHSLGAACAQRFMLHYTSSTGRIPLPGQTISARLYDDPAINEEDNEAFIAFGNKHASLLVDINSKFSIFRRQEAGDFVTQSGEVHLGATPNYYTDEVYKWLNFNSALQSPTSHARVSGIRDYVTAHGRVFGDESSRFYHVKKMRSKLEKKQGKLLKRQTALQAKVNRSQKEEAELKQVNDELDALNDAKNFSKPGYVLTYYDAATQYNFDKPKNCKIWKDLRELWKLPLRLNPMTAERLRTYVAAFFRSGLFTNALGNQNPEDDALHGNHRGNLDDKGVLVVKLTA